MKSPDEKSYALRLANSTEIARRVFTLWWAERARFHLLMGRRSRSRRLRRLNFWNSRRWRDEMTSRTEQRLRCLRDFRPLAAFVHGDQLGDGDEFESFCEKGVKNLRHRRNRRRMDVMWQNDRARPRSRDNALRDDVGAGRFQSRGSTSHNMTL